MIVDLVAVDPEGRTWQRRWSFEKRVSKRESKRRGGGRYCPSLTLDKGTTERMEGEEKGGSDRTCKVERERVAVAVGVNGRPAVKQVVRVGGPRALVGDLGRRLV